MTMQYIQEKNPEQNEEKIYLDAIRPWILEKVE